MGCGGEEDLEPLDIAEYIRMEEPQLRKCLLQTGLGANLWCIVLIWRGSERRGGEE